MWRITRRYFQRFKAESPGPGLSAFIYIFSFLLLRQFIIYVLFNNPVHIGDIEGYGAAPLAVFLEDVYGFYPLG
jgi:hypothetical protein